MKQCLLFILVLILLYILVRRGWPELFIGVYDVTNLDAYQKPELSETTITKEVNRDFNFEESLSYKTPFNKLDYQDLLIID